VNISFTPEELLFRDEVRNFLNKRAPANVRHKQTAGLRLDKHDMVAWQQSLFEEGWAGINWPVEHGGTGWNATQKYIFLMKRAKPTCPELCLLGSTWWLQ